MKRWICLAVLSALMIGLFCGCASQAEIDVEALKETYQIQLAPEKPEADAAPGEVPEGIPEEAPAGNPEGVPEEVPAGSPEGIPEEIPQEIPEEIPEEVPGETPPTVAEPPAPILNAPWKFDRDESVFCGIQMGMPIPEVEGLLGKADSVEDTTGHEDMFIYGARLIYQYGGAKLSFFDYTGNGTKLLGSFYTEDAGVYLDTGLHVGSTLADIFTFYYYDGSEREVGGSEPWGMYLYGEYLNTYEFGYAHPQRYEQTGLLHYPYGSASDYHLSFTAYLPVDDRIEETSLVFYMDGNDTVTAIRWERYVF